MSKRTTKKIYTGTIYEVLEQIKTAAEDGFTSIEIDIDVDDCGYGTKVKSTLIAVKHDK